MKKRRFIQNALGLTLVNFLLRGTGTVFSILLSRWVGAEGIGLYQLTGMVYGLAITFALSGLTVSVVRIVSEEQARGNTRAARQAMYQCMAIGCGLGCVAGLLLALYAKPLGLFLLGDSRTVSALRLLGIGLPFLSVGAVVRGYYLGLNQPFRSVGSDVFEQLVLMGATFLLVRLCLPRGLEATCCGLVLAGVISELASCVYSLVQLFRQGRRERLTGDRKPGMPGRILSIALPIAAGNYVRSALSALENILLPAGFRRYGASGPEALAQYGVIKGMVMPILFFPSAVLSAFSSLLVPAVSGAKVAGEEDRIVYMTEQCFRVTLMYAFLIAGLFFCQAGTLGEWIYGRASVGTLLRILAPLVPLLYLDQIVDSILKGLNQQLSAMKYNTADAVMRVTLIYFLTPLLGIWGYLITYWCGTVFNAFMSLHRLLKVSQIQFRLVRWVGIPLGILVVSCLAGQLFSGVTQAIVTVLSYFVLLCLTGCLTKKDYRWAVHIFKG